MQHSECGHLQLPLRACYRTARLYLRPRQTASFPVLSCHVSVCPGRSPISHSLMRVPVVGPSGTTFDFDYIRK